MLAVSLKWIAEKVDGVLHGADITVDSVTTDSRHIESSDLFIALVGTKFNGHDYVSMAEQKGASAVLVSEPVEKK